MALNILKIVQTRVFSKIQDTPNFEYFMDDLYPGFREKFANEAFSPSELEDINNQINNFSSYLYNDLIIAIRLSGGCIETARICNVDGSYLVDVLKSNSETLHLEFARLMVKHGLVEQEFFNKTRMYFPRKFITYFRQVNLSKLFLNAVDYQEVFSIISKLLANHIDVLVSLQKGDDTPLSCWACRKIEAELGLKRGLLDSRPRSFSKKIHRYF